jgi:tagaturonate epimerase
MKKTGKYSFGLGDRFGHQGSAQLRAITDASARGIEITPVWNKSNREHVTIGTEPPDVRKEADTVTAKAGFRKDYFVDADHINLDTVGRFIASSDFFTIDVASYIGKKASDEEIEGFLKGVAAYDEFRIPELTKKFSVSRDEKVIIAEKYLFAAKKAREVYDKIAGTKGENNFVTEVSMDEVMYPQSPSELFFILKMLADLKIPVQTIAPKFSGRFNKGVDYVGDPDNFAAEFESDLMVIDFAVKEFGLPENLKMSVHSGSDKFAIYPLIGNILKKHDKGVHIKTAGTTWLEEVIGLAASGGEALRFAKELYAEALIKKDELCAPYADVIEIRNEKLPSAAEVSGWSAEKLASSLRHASECSDYNPDMRQLMHVGYKLAAHRMDDFFGLLEQNEARVAESVHENIFNKHICRLFGIK